MRTSLEAVIFLSYEVRTSLRRRWNFMMPMDTYAFSIWLVIWRRVKIWRTQLRLKGRGFLWKIGIVIELPRSVAAGRTHAKNVYNLWDSAGYPRAKGVLGVWRAIPRAAWNFCNKTSAGAGDSNRCWSLCTFWQIIWAQCRDTHTHTRWHNNANLFHEKWIIVRSYVKNVKIFLYKNFI